MRVKRLKHVKKLTAFYKTTFGFREPFQILVDLTFCQFALIYKINIKEQIPKYIEGESQLFTTKCILEEGKLLGQQLRGALLVCKQFKVRKCGHKETATAQECIKSMIGTSNISHLFVASQDHELRAELRKIPGVPLLHIHYNALVLEKPSKDTLKQAQKVDFTRTAPSQYQKEEIARLKKKIDINQDTERKPRRKKIKGVNPLAMKKKKNKTVGVAGKQVNRNEKKRRRKKKKIAQHVLNEIKKKTIN